VPSTVRLAPSPPTDLSSQAPLRRWQGWRGEPQVRCQAHQGNSSALPSHREQSPRQGEQSNFFRSTLEEPRSITTQHTTGYKAVMFRPAQTSREATPSNDKETPSNIAAHCAQVGVKGSNKRRKQCPLGTATMTNRDDDRD
jgi:hypothetical protein